MYESTASLLEVPSCGAAIGSIGVMHLMVQRLGLAKAIDALLNSHGLHGHDISRQEHEGVVRACLWKVECELVASRIRRSAGCLAWRVSHLPERDRSHPCIAAR